MCDPLLPLLLFGEYTEVVYITYTMASQDSPDIYALARGPQANPSWPWYNYYSSYSKIGIAIQL